MTGRYIRTPAIPDEQIKGGFYMKTRISAVRMEDMENEAAELLEKNGAAYRNPVTQLGKTACLL
jgi:hypothetical protein